MRKSINIIFAVISIPFFIFFWYNEYFILIGALLIYIAMITPFLLIKRNVKNGKYISVGKDSVNKLYSITSLSFGILIIILAIFFKNGMNSIFGINPIMLGGVTFVINGLLRTQKSLFLLTDKTIQFESYKSDKDVEWEYEKLDKVVIREKEIQFVKGKESVKFNIEEGYEVSRAIQDFLLPKLENRLTIE